MCALDHLHIDNLRWQRVIKQDSDIIKVSLKTSIRTNNLGHICYQPKANRASRSSIDAFSSRHCDVKEFAGLTTEMITSPFYPGSNRVKVLLFCSTDSCKYTTYVQLLPCVNLAALKSSTGIPVCSLCPTSTTAPMSEHSDISFCRVLVGRVAMLQVRPWPITVEDPSSVHRSPGRWDERNA